MSKALLALAFLSIIGTFFMINEDRGVQNKFAEWKQKHNKKYTVREEEYRMKVFADNLAFIEKQNQKGAAFGVTKFFDLTDEEFAARYLTKKVSSHNTPTVDLPKTVTATEHDWRLKGAVTPVKNQGQCGSCWTFSATGILEGFFKIETGTLPSLSEQQLVDCSGIIDLNYGCDGGDKLRAMNYVKRQGITTEAAYPYEGVKGSCRTKGGAFHIKAPVRLTGTEDSLIQGLNKYPVGISVDASNWKYYDPSVKSIFSDCDNKTMNHDIIAVGYTPTYIIVKNSWSQDWGVDGYIHLARGGDTCAMLQDLVIAS